MLIVRLVVIAFIINASLFSKSPDFTIENPHIIAIMVEFQEEIPNDPLTSGSGNFLDESFNIDMIWNNNIQQRCDHYLVDKPPHHSQYFSNQIEALKNYYIDASNGKITISGHVLLSEEEDGYYRLDKYMQDYAYSDNGLALLFKESLELAEDDIKLYLENNLDINMDDIIFTVFHAGIGQDFSFPTFDPSIYDIKSAYVESSMFSNNDYPIIDGYEINSGILLPETQNMIYFDSIEDIYYGNDDYCDFQLGLTGTFSFLMGYALNLPPLFNTESGKPGVGVFGLMDYGAHNGRGVIPAMPSPWTRILKDWEEPINMTDSAQTNPLIFDIESNNIYKFNISEKEYFLIENHSSTLSDGTLFQDIISTDKSWFDSIIDSNLDIFTFSQDSSVITSISNYNFGLPGSGILIWHIDEPFNIDTPINNDILNKSVSIEEADGALDIGFESYALFSNDDPTNGTKWDFWFLDNDAYSYTNNNDEVCYDQANYQDLNYIYKFQCESNGGLWVKPLLFDKFSNPNSSLKDLTDSFFSFELIDSISSNLKRVKVKYESPFEYMDYSYLSDYEISGTSPTHIFFTKDTITNPDLTGDFSLYSFDILNQEFVFDSIFCCESLVVLTDSDNNSTIHEGNITTSVENYYLDPNDELILNYINTRFGFFNSIEWVEQITAPLVSSGENIWYLDNLVIPSTANLSIGDIDFDGLDEILWTSDGKIMAANYNGTMVNNFPIKDNYHGIVLIVENEDDEIVLVSRNSNHIDILSLDGNLLYSLPSIGTQDILAIGGKLTDGVRFYDFPIGENSYWLQKYSTHSHYPLPSGEHIIPEYQNINQKITNFYNYPNPINNGETTFRFMVHEQGDIDINIFNLLGDKVDGLALDNPTTYEYNEIDWNIGSLLPGLYFAEIMADGKKVKIIKVVIGY